MDEEDRSLRSITSIEHPPAFHIKPLVLAVPQFGPARADRLLARCRIADAKTVGVWGAEIRLVARATSQLTLRP